MIGTGKDGDFGGGDGIEEGPVCRLWLPLIDGPNPDEEFTAQFARAVR